MFINLNSSSGYKNFAHICMRCEMTCLTFWHREKYTLHLRIRDEKLLQLFASQTKLFCKQTT